MRRMMLCALALLLSAAALAEGLSGDGAITWETPFGAAASWLGDGAETGRPDPYGYREISADGAAWLGQSCRTLWLRYDGDRLYELVVHYADADVPGGARALIDALSARYGAPETPPTIRHWLDVLYARWVGDARVPLSVWRLPDGTRVTLEDTRRLEMEGGPVDFQLSLHYFNMDTRAGREACEWSRDTPGIDGWVSFLNSA